MNPNGLTIIKHVFASYRGAIELRKRWIVPVETCSRCAFKISSVTRVLGMSRVAGRHPRASSKKLKSPFPENILGKDAGETRFSVNESLVSSYSSLVMDLIVPFFLSTIPSLLCLLAGLGLNFTPYEMRQLRSGLRLYASYAEIASGAPCLIPNCSRWHVW